MVGAVQGIPDDVRWAEAWQRAGEGRRQHDELLELLGL